MDEQSIWKKEISFRRKPKEDAKRPVSDREVPPTEDTEPTSIWKKEISFRRKSKHDTVSSGHDQLSDTEPSPKESIWKEEISFGRKAKKDLSRVEPVAETPVAEPVAAESGVGADASGHGQVSDTESGTQDPVWKREVSFTRKPEEKQREQPADVVVEEEPTERIAEEEPTEPVAEAAPTEPGAEETPTQEPVSAEADTASAGDDQVSDIETGPGETVWKKEVSFSRQAEEAAEPVAKEPVAEEPVADEPVPAKPVATETWSAKLSLPVAETQPVVHPPVPAAELPPLPDEKVPFWKKEISFGGKKREKLPKAEGAPKEPKEREPKTPKVKIERSPKGAKRLVGLKIGASQLAAARVANNGSAELLQVAREPLNPGIVVGGELRDPDALSAALKDFFTKHKLPKRGVRLGIANNRIGVRTFEITGIEDQKQLANAIRFRAQEALPIPIDEAVLDYQILGEGVDEEGQPTRRILLVVAYRELIDRYVDACRKAGIALVGIDLEAFALLRALQAPQDGVGNDPSAALVAVAIGHERSTFAVSDGRVCEFTRVLEWGGSMLNVAIARVLDAAPSEVEDVKRSMTLTDSTVPHGLNAEQATKAVEAVRKAIQTFARELVSSLQYYQNQPGSLGIGEIVLTGGTTHLPGLAAELERLIGVRVRVGDPLARMKVSKKVGEPEQVGSLAVAIGLGIED